MALVTPYKIRIGKFEDNILLSGHAELHTGEISSVMYRILSELDDIKSEKPFRRPVHYSDLKVKWAMMITGDTLKTSQGNTYYVGIRLFRGSGKEEEGSGQDFTPTGRGIALTLEELCSTLEILGNCLTAAYSLNQANRILTLEMAELATATLEEGVDIGLSLYTVEKMAMAKIKETAAQALGKSGDVVKDVLRTWGDLILSLSTFLVLRKRTRQVLDAVHGDAPEKRKKRVLCDNDEEEEKEERQTVRDN